MQEKDWVTELSHRMGWTQQETSEWVARLGDAIASRLVDGDVVNLQGLGRFETKKLNERVLKDTAADKQYLLPPELIPVFQIEDHWGESEDSPVKTNIQQP